MNHAKKHLWYEQKEMNHDNELSIGWRIGEVTEESCVVQGIRTIFEEELIPFTHKKHQTIMGGSLRYTEEKGYYIYHNIYREHTKLMAIDVSLDAIAEHDGLDVPESWWEGKTKIGEKLQKTIITDIEKIDTGMIKNPLHGKGPVGAERNFCMKDIYEAYEEFCMHEEW